MMRYSSARGRYCGPQLVKDMTQNDSLTTGGGQFFKLFLYLNGPDKDISQCRDELTLCHFY